MDPNEPSFCLNCFATIPVSALICPHCGAVVADMRGQSFAVKLIHALRHPLADIRLRAIVALGLRAQADAVPALIECALARPTDVVAGLQIVASLKQIQGSHPDTKGLEELAARHPARPIRRAAAQAAQQCSAVLRR